MTAYTSTAVRDGRIWRVQCDQHPTALSTVSRLADAPAHQREAIAFVTQTNPDDVDVTVTPDLPDDATAHLTAAAALRDQAAAAQHEAAAQYRAAAQVLSAAGIPLRDIGTILGISHQRAHQLTH